MSGILYYFSIFVVILVQLGGVLGQCDGKAPASNLQVGMNDTTVTYTWSLDDVNLAVRIDGNLITGRVNMTIQEFSYSFPIGTTIVNVFVSESDTQVACSFEVTAIDMHPPVISDCPSDLAFSVSQKVSWPPPTVMDNSGCFTLTQTGPTQDTEFPVGTTQISYEARDCSGNIDNCNFFVNVTAENNAPEIQGCPPPELGNDPALRVNVDTPGATSQRVTWTEPSSNTNGATRSSNVVPGSEFQLGSTFVLYNFTSASTPPVQTECSFYIIVSPFVDNQAPVVTCPSNIVRVAEVNNPTATVTWDAEPPTDNVGVVSSVFIPSSGSSFGIGTTTVFYSAQDEAGNQADCTFTVTIVENTDTEGPVFMNCPRDFEVFVANGLQSEVVNWSPPTVFDESATTTTSTHTPPEELTVAGSPHTITYTAMDAAGNTRMCSFQITVSEDREAPVINCNGLDDITVYVREAEENVPVNITWNEPDPLATDNSGSVSVVRSKGPGSLFLPDTMESIQYTATDGVGLTSQCLFEVSVEVDRAPIFRNCTDYRLETDPNSNTASFILPAPIATDMNPETGTDTATILSATVTPPTIPTQFGIGTTTFTWTTTDSRGSVTQCVINVIVTDAQAPVILGCPDNIVTTVANSTFLSAVVTWTEPIVQENSGPDVSLTATHSPGSTLPAGNYTVRYTAEDRSGNQAVCSFQILVQDLPDDTTLPELSGCPSNIFTTALPDLDYRDVTWTPPTATDNEDTNVDLIASHNPNDRFYIGDTTVTYTAIDDRNNRQVCSFRVVVQDDQNPVFTQCPDNVFQLVNPNTVTTLIKVDDVVVTDNSGTVMRNENFQFRETVANSPVQRNLVASDASGNQATCLVVVTIQETIDVFTYPGTVVMSQIRNQTAVPTSLDNIESDLDDYFRCSSLANDFVGISLLGSPSLSITFELSFYRGSDNNPYSERGRYISRTIETAFVEGLTGTPPSMFPTGNVVQSDTFQLNVCEFRGSLTLLSSSADGSDLNILPLLISNSVAELTLRELIHGQLDRTYQAEGSFITSVVLRPFVESTIVTNAIIVDFVLVFRVTATAGDPSESTVKQLFEDQLRFDSTLNKTQLGTSSLFVSTSNPFSIIKICSTNYCLNGGTCIVDDSFSPVCRCTSGFFGTRCTSTTFTASPPITVTQGLSTGALIGIIGGAIALLLLLLLLLCCCFCLVYSSQPKAGPLVGPVVPYEEPIAYVPPVRRPRAIAYSAPPSYAQEPFVEMLIPEPVIQPSSVVSYPSPAYRAGPIIEEVESYPAYKRPYLDPYF